MKLPLSARIVHGPATSTIRCLVTLATPGTEFKHLEHAAAMWKAALPQVFLEPHHHARARLRHVFEAIDHATKVATRASWSLPPLPKFSSPSMWSWLKKWSTPSCATPVDVRGK